MHILNSFNSCDHRQLPNREVSSDIAYYNGTNENFNYRSENGPENYRSESGDENFRSENGHEGFRSENEHTRDYPFYDKEPEARHPFVLKLKKRPEPMQYGFMDTKDTVFVSNNKLSARNHEQLAFISIEDSQKYITSLRPAFEKRLQYLQDFFITQTSKARLFRDFYIDPSIKVLQEFYVDAVGKINSFRETFPTKVGNVEFYQDFFVDAAGKIKSCRQSFINQLGNVDFYREIFLDGKGKILSYRESFPNKVGNVEFWRDIFVDAAGKIKSCRESFPNKVGNVDFWRDTFLDGAGKIKSFRESFPTKLRIVDFSREINVNESGDIKSIQDSFINKVSNLTFLREFLVGESGKIDCIQEYFTNKLGNLIFLRDVNFDDSGNIKSIEASFINKEKNIHYVQEFIFSSDPENSGSFFQDYFIDPSGESISIYKFLIDNDPSSYQTFLTEQAMDRTYKMLQLREKYYTDPSADLEITSYPEIITEQLEKLMPLVAEFFTDPSNGIGSEFFLQFLPDSSGKALSIDQFLTQQSEKSWFSKEFLPEQLEKLSFIQEFFTNPAEKAKSVKEFITEQSEKVIPPVQSYITEQSEKVIPPVQNYISEQSEKIIPPVQNYIAEQSEKAKSVIAEQSEKAKSVIAEQSEKVIPPPVKNYIAEQSEKAKSVITEQSGKVIPPVKNYIAEQLSKANSNEVDQQSNSNEVDQQSNSNEVDQQSNLNEVDQQSNLNEVDQQSNSNSTKSGRSNFIWNFLTRRKKIKIYLVVKPKRLEFNIPEERELNSLDEKSKSEDESNHIEEIGYSVLPISTMESINSHAASAPILLRDLMFRHDGIGGVIVSKTDIRPQDRGKIPFLVDHSISTNLSYEHDLPYQHIGIKPDDLGTFERQNFVDELSSRIKTHDLKKFLNSKNTEDSFTEDFWILPDEEDEDFDETKYWVLMYLNQEESPYSEDFEYNCADIDPNGTFSLHRKFLSRTDKKDLIPVFSSLEEAEKFLLTTLEESLEPFKKHEIHTTPDSLDKTSTNDRFNIILDDRRIYNARNVDYLDESTSFAFNNYPLNLPITNKERKINKLAEKRKIKTLSNYRDHYDSNNYDTIRDLFGVNKKPVWYSTYMPAWIPKAQTNLLQTGAKTEIIEMDLDDFLKFWSTNEKKMGEIFYIPTSNKSKSFSSNKKKPLKKIHQYQRDFHIKARQKNTKYSYKIKSKK